MVQSISSRQAAVMTGAAERLGRDVISKTSVFSVNSAASGSAAAAASSPAESAPAGRTTAIQSQSNSAAVSFRQLFGGSAGPIVAAASSPAVADAPFSPAFRKATGSDGTLTWNLNPTYFATKDTAQWIATKYGTGEVIEAPFGGVGGIFSASALEYHIRLPDGREVNAGILAGYYDRNPPDKFPGLAEKLIKSQLGLE
jgi:hypothetical protein